MNTGPQQFPDDRDALSHLLGELDESQTDDYFAALKQWSGDSASISESPRHVPAAILSRWNRLRPLVSPLERDLIEFHLRECEDCRKDLDFADSFAGDADDGESSPRPRVRVLPWIGGGVLGAAIAASVLLTLIPRETTAPSTPGLESMDWVAPAFTRGIGSEVALPATGRPLLLVLAVGTPESGLLQVEILDSDDRVLFDREISADEVHGGSLLLRWQADPSRPWQPGRYRCRLYDGDQVREGEFVLVR